MQKYLNFIRQTVRVIVIGVTIGFMVALFQFLMVQLTHFLMDVFVNHVLWKMIAFFIALPIIIFYSYLFTSKNPNIRSGGIPQLENNLKHHRERLNWFKDLPMMIFSSLCSFCAYGTLGGEGPSVVIGGNSALMINSLFHEKDYESVWIGAGAAFGCAFQSPISGLIYCLETLLPRFSIKAILKSIIIIFISFLVIYTIFPHKVLTLEIDKVLPFELWYVGLIVVIMNFIFGTLFLKGIKLVKEYLKKHPNSFYNKYKVFIFYGVTIILAFFLGKYMGSGSSFLGILPLESVWYILLLLCFFRLILTIHSSTASISGGIVIPQLAIGGVVGMFIMIIVHNLFNVSLDYTGEIILLSMLSFYVIVMESPFTGIALTFAFVSFDNALKVLPLVIIVMLLSRLVSYINGEPSLYHLVEKDL